MHLATKKITSWLKICLLCFFVEVTLLGSRGGSVKYICLMIYPIKVNLFWTTNVIRWWWLKYAGHHIYCLQHMTLALSVEKLELIKDICTLAFTLQSQSLKNHHGLKVTLDNFLGQIEPIIINITYFSSPWIAMEEKRSKRWDSLPPHLKRWLSLW